MDCSSVSPALIIGLSAGAGMGIAIFFNKVMHTLRPVVVKGRILAGGIEVA